MRKVIKIKRTICDLCGDTAELQCELCKKDICQNCARWICRKEAHASSGGFTITSFSQYGFDPYPFVWKPEKTLCKECVENFKLAIGCLVGKAKR